MTAGSYRLPYRKIRDVAPGRRGLDKVVALQEKFAGGLQVELPIDRDKGQQGMKREGEDAAKQSTGYTDGKAPMFEVGNALCVRMISKDAHFSSPLGGAVCELHRTP